MKNFLFNIFILLIAPVIWYVLISFLNVEINPLLWTFWSRFWFVVLSLIGIGHNLENLK